MTAEQICPDCEKKLEEENYDTILPEKLRILLKCTLPEIQVQPEPAKDEKPSEDSNDQDVAHHLQTVDGRLAALEAKFDGVDSKLDQLLTLIQGMAPAPVPQLSTTHDDHLS